MKAVAGLFYVFTPLANAALSTDPFVYDPQFNGGVVIEDRFAATTQDTHDQGLRVTIGGDGSVIASGLVGPAYQAPAPPGNFGMVRYGAAGERTPWASPTASYSYFDNHYVDYPNSSGVNIGWVSDMKAFRGYVYALVDVGPANGNRDVHVLAFRDGDGTFVGDTSAFASGLDEMGAALVPYCEHHLVVNNVPVLECNLVAIATYWTGSRNVITMKRFSINPADGGLSVSTTFGISNNGAMDQAAPDALCDAGSGCSWIASSATVLRSADDVNPTLYLAGTVQTSATEHDGVVIAVNGSDGSLADTFGNGSGIYVNYQASSSNGVVIAASTSGDPATDVVFLVAETPESCGARVAVTKLRAQVSGPGGPQTLPDYSWGNGGTRDIGGNGGLCGNVYTNVWDTLLDGDRLVVVGYETNGTFHEPLFAVVRAGDGALINYERGGFSPLRSDGSAWGGGVFASVAARGEGRYAVSGWLYDASAGNATLFGTASLVSDRIFGDDFE